MTKAEWVCSNCKENIVMFITTKRYSWGTCPVCCCDKTDDKGWKMRRVK